MLPFFCRKLFWGEITGVARIEVADLDGANRRVFTSDNVNYPMGVTVDYQEGRLYWADDMSDTIESADINTGLDRRSIAIQDERTYSHTVFGIAVYQVGQPDSIKKIRRRSYFM